MVREQNTNTFFLHIVLKFFLKKKKEDGEEREEVNVYYLPSGPRLQQESFLVSLCLQP